MSEARERWRELTLTLGLDPEDPACAARTLKPPPASETRPPPAGESAAPPVGEATLPWSPDQASGGGDGATAGTVPRSSPRLWPAR